MGSVCGGLDDDLTGEIDEAVNKSVLSIPKSYATERERIIKNMRQAAPRPYENLLFSDFPEKNGSQVNALAWKNVTSDKAKDQITDEVYDKIREKINEKTAGQNELARDAARRAARKAVAKSVDATIERLGKNLDDMITK